MTGLEMQLAFERYIQNANKDLKYAEKLDTETIYGFLNQAYRVFLKEKYMPSDSIVDNISVINRHNKDLHKLIKKQECPTGAISDNEYKYLVLLPEDYLCYIRSSIKITRTTIYPMSNVVSNVTLKDQSQVGKFLISGFNKPIVRTPIAIITNSIEYITSPTLPSPPAPVGWSTDSYLLLITDAYTTKESHLFVTYLKKPENISEIQDCELSSHLHEQIVQLAVQLFESQYYKLATKEQPKQ